MILRAISYARRDSHTSWDLMNHQRHLSLLDIRKFVIPCKRKKFTFSSPTDAYLQIHGRDWLGCHAGHQEVGRCCTRTESQGICNTYIPLQSANKATNSGFEKQRRYHQKSKTGASVALQKGLMSSKFFLKENKQFYYMKRKRKIFNILGTNIKSPFLCLLEREETDRRKEKRRRDRFEHLK